MLNFCYSPEISYKFHFKLNIILLSLETQAFNSYPQHQARVGCVEMRLSSVLSDWP